MDECSTFFASFATYRGRPMIDVVNVAKSYNSGERRVNALRGVDCRIGKGRFAFIVGPSGSGKSTLLYLLGALDRPTSGEIWVEGLNLAAMSEAEANAYRREKVGFIFQSFNLISNLTAIENVLVPFLPRGLTPELKDKATELLRQVGLGERIDHRPYQMSGGEQQRVAIARALIKDPILVLADEPTGELDSRTGDEIYRILRRLQDERQTTLVVVTHDRRFITPDDLVLEIQDGRLLTDGLSEAQDDLAESDVGFEPLLGSARFVEGENTVEDRAH
jgi:putative ABC transport system ATP-binding protein